MATFCCNKSHELAQFQPFGVFVEIGAGNGDSDSSTLMLEKDKQWRGILIEPDRQLFREMLTKKRKSKMVNTCVRVGIVIKGDNLRHSRGIGTINAAILL